MYKSYFKESITKFYNVPMEVEKAIIKIRLNSFNVREMNLFKSKGKTFLILALMSQGYYFKVYEFEDVKEKLKNYNDFLNTNTDKRIYVRFFSNYPSVKLNFEPVLVAGSYFYDEGDYITGATHSESIKVIPEYRRLGIATAMIDYAELINGKPYKPSSALSKDMMDFVKNRFKEGLPKPEIKYMNNKELFEFAKKVIAKQANLKNDRLNIKMISKMEHNRGKSGKSYEEYIAGYIDNLAKKEVDKLKNLQDFVFGKKEAFEDDWSIWDSAGIDNPVGLHFLSKAFKIPVPKSNSQVTDLLIKWSDNNV